MGKRFILSTNKRGQITFPKEVMEHCGLPTGGNSEWSFCQTEFANSARFILDHARRHQSVKSVMRRKMR
jgi:hypothetical protein